MATLLLTTVGGVLGGPIGAAIGALAGQTLDRSLFGPGPREGPRLTELGVQTSSYGTEIAKLFGRMRVAGTVIWATDLIETRSTEEGGKGQPDAHRYTYSASLAVLLSARPIRAVHRIWADGKLLRGSAGDFKVATGFHLHTGDPDQPVDPLIASAEGVGTPAHRGSAYAVFENLQLAEFANRIPSLTFEVEADAGPVDAALIGAALGGIGAENVPLPAFDGFSAHGGSARAVIEMLAEATGSWFVPGDGLTLRAGLGAARTIEDAGVAVGDGERRRGTRAIAPADAAPRTVSIGHNDAARDYQAGLQRATRPGAGSRERHLELPAVLSATSAKRTAAAMLARADTERQRRSVSLGWEGLDIKPGDRVAIAGEAGSWRVVDWTLEGMVVRLDLVPLALASASAVASPGTGVPAPDRVHGPTRLVAIELPQLDDTRLTTPRIHVLAAGTMPGWRAASLLLRPPGGGNWQILGSSRGPATIGEVLLPPAPAGTQLEDRWSEAVIELAHDEMRLVPADAAAMDGGANLALIGDELVQFGSAERIAPRRWRIGRLWRGRRGTEAAAASHVAGERFVLIERAAMLPVDLPLSTIGTAVRVAALGIGDASMPVEAEVLVRGTSVAPPSPVHLTIAGGPAGRTLGWVRRSRVGWRWIDGVDTPLGEEGERYLATIAGPGVPLGSVEAFAPSLALPDGPLTVQLRQWGMMALSPPAIIETD